jgi:putative endonuclease
LVERNLAKVDVAGSSPVSRSTIPAKPVFFALFFLFDELMLSFINLLSILRCCTQVAQGEGLQNLYSSVRIRPAPQIILSSHMYTVYILKSSKDKKRYIGFTDNLERRLFEHNSGKVTSTKHLKPLQLIYSEQFDFKIDAMNREKFFKTHSGRDFLDSIGK